MEEKKNTAEVLVESLLAEGVDTIFGIPGEETLDLMFAIRNSSIRFITTRHEQGASPQCVPGWSIICAPLGTARYRSVIGMNGKCVWMS